MDILYQRETDPLPAAGVGRSLHGERGFYRNV